jgi:hypothetical protein
MELFTFIGIVWAVWIVIKTGLVAIGTKIEHEELKEKLAEKIRVVRLEELNDQKTILAFDAENGQFLGQGKDQEEVKQHIIGRFPERVFILGEQIFSGLKGNIKVLTDATTNAS